jgi:hypothetical protein
MHSGRIAVAIVIITGLGAAICAPALLIWLLGVPGHPSSRTNYVRGWEMGFLTLMTYPSIWVPSFVAWCVLSSRDKREHSRTWIPSALLALMVCSFLVWAVLMQQAFLMTLTTG